MKSAFKIFYFYTLFLFFGYGELYAIDNDSSKRPFYEHKGNYGKNILDKKAKFKSAFGYELVDLGRNWSPVEIDVMHSAFEQLPPAFHKIPDLKYLYRLESIILKDEAPPAGDVPAATLPSFSTIYENLSNSYRVFIENQELRVEFYNPLFHEDRIDLINIIQHEMAHAFDFSRKFISFSDEWISLAKFKTLHIFALDGIKGSDSLYSLVNDPNVDNYAPISKRNISTYSRHNPQEDFANSVTAYIHYPYFRYTHPARYKFLKTNVFDGKEYFLNDSRVKGFEQKIKFDIERALENGAWIDVQNILIELSRSYFPGLEKIIIKHIDRALGTISVSQKKDKILGLATCYLMQPEGLELRKNLIRSQRISVKETLNNSKCFRHARDSFEKNISKWPPSNLFFYKNEGISFIQFMDPAISTAYLRGFNTKYFWKIFIEGEKKKLLVEGFRAINSGGNGSVKINLIKSNGTKFELPQGQVLRLELMAKRTHPTNFKSFESNPAVIRFIVHPWFSYIGPNPPEIRVMFPLNSLKNAH